MLTSKAKLSAQVRTKLGLATTLAALSMAAVPVAGATAVNGYPISAALHACSGLTDDWGYVYRACMAQHGQEE
jgi:hypothetical protein